MDNFRHAPESDASTAKAASRERIVVAMSGGVDSSVAAGLLVEQGHEVVGITLRVWSYDGPARCGSCCAPEDVDDARAVCDQLGIPFYVADAEELFRERVVQPFVREYQQGRTPIPCVACNRDIKFDFLLKRARSLGAKLATGHYARVEGEPGHRRLLTAVDEAKDQSYFLFGLGPRELDDVRFPVGHLTKAEVRAHGARLGLCTSHKPESQEICFVPDGDYARFVEKVGGGSSSGEIVDGNGQVLGQHGGVHRFTIGQRKGLGGGTKLPLYVQRIEADSGRVVVGTEKELWQHSLEVAQLSWTSGNAPSEPTRIRVKIRNRHQPAEGLLRLEDDGRAKVELSQPVRAVTPGQAAVFYRGDEVLGGGYIRNWARPSSPTSSSEANQS
jgi:tRNA-specific 2-thiouridylase